MSIFATSSVTPPVVAAPAVTEPVGPVAPRRWRAVCENAGAFGLLGAGIGAALTLTGLPIVGGAFAPFAAAIGGAIGVLVGVAKGLIQTRGASDAVAGVGELPDTEPPVVDTTPPMA